MLRSRSYDVRVVMQTPFFFWSLVGAGRTQREAGMVSPHPHAHGVDRAPLTGCLPGRALQNTHHQRRISGQIIFLPLSMPPFLGASIKTPTHLISASTVLQQYMRLTLMFLLMLINVSLSPTTPMDATAVDHVQAVRPPVFTLLVYS